MIYRMAFILLFFSTFILAQGKKENAKKVEKTAIGKYISNNKLQKIHYDTTTTIAKDQIIDANVIVKNGDLIIAGTVKGDVLVLFGNLRIKNTARIEGDVACIDGSIYQAEQGVVLGNQIETSSKNLIKKDDWELERKKQNDVETDNWMIDDYHGEYAALPFGFWKKQFLFRFNPVQGWFVGLSLPEHIKPLEKYLDIYGFLGYGFSESRWSWGGGINRWLFDRYKYRTEIGIRGYDYTASNDEWIISPFENTLTSVFLHESNQDYYGKKGFEVHISQNVSFSFKATLAYRSDRYAVMINTTDWALLYPDRRYRSNIEIDPGNMRALYGELFYDTRNNKYSPSVGWYGKLSMELSNPALGSDFYFNQYFLEVRRYQRMGKLSRLDIRFMAGSSEHYLPVQKNFYLGGFSSLRGFSYKEFSGNRTLLTNLEYNISPQFMFTDFLLGAMRFVIFFDFGYAWFADPNDKWYRGYSSLSVNDIKFNYGIALGSYDGNFRLAVAKRTDRSSNAVSVIFRLRKPF